jgi:hypothetical protein
MLIPFGILSAAGAGVEGDFELIESEILGSAASSVTFSNLGTYSSTYKHLQLRATVRSDRSGLTLDFGKITFNGDSSSVYTTHQLYGDGSTVQSFAGINQAWTNFVRTTGATAPANAFGAGVVDILDAYSTTKFKTIRNLGGVGASGGEINLASGLWRSTNSITSMTIAVGGGTNWLTGSRFSLYGIRG